jgi:hypothetical protein
MKKWLTLVVLGVSAAATAGLSYPAGLSLRAAVQQQDWEPTDAEVEAQVDARLQEVMHALLAGQRSEEGTAALHR